MHTELLSLSKIFTENIYRIPDYQRGYSWKERQLKDFWSDLVLLDKGRDHYTGVLTLEEVTPENYQRWTDDLWILESKRYKPYYVVDGQQRLTTSLLLLQALLEQLKEGDELNYSSSDDIRKKYIFESRDRGVSRSYIFGYEKDNPSYEFLKTRIFMEQSDSHEIGEQTIYTHNLIFAKSFFSKKLAGMMIPQLADVFTKITQHFLFNIYTISAGIDVFVAFETMNNRGKPLSHLELLKNRLIFLSTRLESDPIERPKVRLLVNEAWKTAYHYLGRNQKRPLDDDRFLANQFILYAGPALYNEKQRELSRRKLFSLIREDEYKNYLLDGLFTYRNIQKEEANEAAGADPLMADSNLDAPTSKPSLSSDDLCDFARDIKSTVQVYYGLLNPEDSDYDDDQKLFLTRLGRLGWADSLPLNLAIAKQSKSALSTAYLSNLERYLFLRTLIDTYSRFEEELNLTEWAIRFKKKLISVEDLTQTLQEMIDKKVANVNAHNFSPPNFQRGYYAWRTIKYFLFEYEQELKRKTKSLSDKITWDEFSKDNYEYDYSTVEHVYPQRAKKEEWGDQFTIRSAKEKQSLRNSLGNLVALSHPKNAALGNRSFAEKKRGTAETTGYSGGSYSEIEVSEYEDWTPQAIVDRGMKMLAFMEKRWRFNLKDQNARLKVLGLPFLGNHVEVDVQTNDDEASDS